MRARSLLQVVIPVALAIVVGCGRTQPPDNPPKVEDGTAQVGPVLQGDQGEKVDVGAPLYTRADAPKYPFAQAADNDPIIIANCTVQYEDRQTVSAEVDGTIEVIATPMSLRPDGVYEIVLHDGKKITHDPAKFDGKNASPGIEFIEREKRALPNNPEKWVPYWRIRDGSVVFAGQVICRLDDSLWTTKKKSAEKVKEASATGQSAAKKGVELTEEKMRLAEKGKGVIAAVEFLNDQITLTRFVENLAQSLQAIAKAEAEFEEANVMLGRHQIKSRVDGIVRAVSKRPGEFARAGEKIFEIQSTEKVRLEGNLDVENYDAVKRRMNLAVTVEPAVPSAPVRSLGARGHRQEVTGVAVTGHTKTPLVVSVGLDGAALVWDPNLGGAKDRPASPHNLPHPVSVRSVACTPPGSKAALAVTGADDGRVRVWDLADPNKLPTTTARAPEEIHSSSVTAVAVSADGRFAATAAGREVFVWDLNAGKKLYALPDSHRDGITSLAFTPQCELVTASKDRTIKRWKLGAEKAAVVRTIDHRSGVVDVLGVSPDGGRVVFDQDKARLDVLNLSDAQTVGQFTNVGPSAAFARLAVFAPDHSDPKTPVDQLPPYRVVTAGGEGDLKGGLQVWNLSRAGGRGAEIARLITPGRATVTCAAFSPHKDTPFLVVGTAAGSVHVWTPPSGPATKLEGRITNIDSTDPRYVTVRVEMNNKGVGLLDRSAATVIVDQSPVRD